MGIKASISFDDALESLVGQFGWGQAKVVFFSSLCWIANAFVFFCWVFMSAKPKWQCNDPDDAECAAAHGQQSGPGASTQAFCMLQPEQWHWESQDSVIAKFNLVCSKQWQVQFVNTLMFIGCFIGAGIWGRMNDKMGRRNPLFIATAITAAATLVSAAAPNYWVLAVARAVAGMGAAGQSQCVMLICTETTGPSCRGLASTASLSFITLGEFLLVAVAHAFPRWSQLALAAGALNAATLLMYPLVPESARWLASKGRMADALAVMKQLTPDNGNSMCPTVVAAFLNSSSSSSSTCTSSHQDHSSPAKFGIDAAGKLPCNVAVSPRHKAAKPVTAADWVTSPRCSAAAVDVWSHVGDIESGKTCPVSPPPVAKQAVVVVAATPTAAACDDVSLWLLLRNGAQLSRTIVLLLAWFCLYVTAYGVVLGSGALPGTIYMTFTMLAAAELIAMLSAAAAVDKLGRQNIITAGLLLGASGCLGCANASGSTMQAVLAVIGKFGCSLSLAVLGTYTAELFPTPVRAQAMGLFNQASRLGSIAAPCMLMAGAAVATAGHGALFMPLLAFGSLAILTCLLVLVVMPETNGLPMPECVEDLSQLQSVLTAQPWCRGGCWACVAFMARCRATNSNSNSQQDTHQQSQHTKPRTNMRHMDKAVPVDCSDAKVTLQVVCAVPRLAVPSSPDTTCGQLVQADSAAGGLADNPHQLASAPHSVSSVADAQQQEAASASTATAAVTHT